MKAEQLMDASILTLRRESTLTEIYTAMNQSRQTDFPVVDSTFQLIGMVYEENVLKVLQGVFESGDSRVGGFADAARCAGRFANMRADEMMVPDISWVSTETEIGKIAEVMKAKGVRCLPVFGNGRVLGVISERTIFMALLNKGLELKKTSVSESREALIKEKAIKERRQYPRKQAFFKLAYKPTDTQGNSTLLEKGRIARCLNLSLGGMLAHVTETANTDDILDLAFEIPSFNQPIRRLARVTRVMPSPEGGAKLGLMFLAFSESESSALAEYVNSLPD